MKILLKLFVFLFLIQVQAQRIYRYNDNGKSSTKEFDLISTKLDLKFNFENQTLDGEAWISLKPHFLAKQKLQLDAKEMDVFEVMHLGKKLKFSSTSEKLNIDLDKKITRNDTLKLYIKYKANPEKVKFIPGAAITDNKGLYFINPSGLDKNKPTQVWTQGEPEQNSVWFPTIDKPNQKSTQEMFLTVPKKFKTLSNGLLLSQKENIDGTRTDHWKQELPHAPYLFFVGIGDFEVVKDSWRGKEVNYYVEPKYKETAKELFKNTPEMLTFFSDLTGVEYPWDKYSQIIVRDYVSGAMENTGAVVHGESAMLSKGKLLERNTWETTIAHELFHHWFGDLVTTESWANITVNESFANYSEYLWLEHKYGKDRAEEHLKRTRDAYINKNAVKANYDKHLVRYNYAKKDDVFDVVSYNKGGMILHMLRKYLGDEKFFGGIKNYLTKYQFKSAEAHQLRLSFEEVSGEDLLWFFSQWYYSNGHPKLKVSYENDYVTKTVKVKVEQLDKIFDFPLTISVFQKDARYDYSVFMDTKQKIFEFPFKKKPKLVVANSDQVLVCELQAPELTLDQLIIQYKNSDNFVSRLNALKGLKELQENKDVFETYELALKDPFDVIQNYVLQNLDLSTIGKKRKVVKMVEKMAKSKNPNIASAAIFLLGKLIDEKYKPIYEKGLKNESPSVVGNSLVSLYYLDKEKARDYISGISAESKDEIHYPLLKLFLKESDKEQKVFVANYLLKAMFFRNYKDVSKEAFQFFNNLAESDNKEAIEVMVNDFVSKGLKYRVYGLDMRCIDLLKQVVEKQNKANHSNKNQILEVLEKGLIALAQE